MNIIQHIQASEKSIAAIGGKAFHLNALSKFNIPIPKWICIPATVILEIIGATSDVAIIRSKIKQFEFPNSFIDYINELFPNTQFLAVRSSAIDEDGQEHSFAGQFESFLYVPKNEITSKIKGVWLSAFSERVFAYRNSNQLHTQLGIAVIIQEMVDATVAGVAFGMNPINGNRNEKVINAVWGLGEGLVSGLLDADVYIIQNNNISKQIADKKQKMILNTHNLSGTILVDNEMSLQKDAVLNDSQINEIGNILDKVYTAFGKYQDIEFAIHNDTIYLLQSRAITILNKIPDQSDVYTLWDNSNIIESYPGVTTPLTFSFISKSYEDAYRLFCAFLGVDARTISNNDRVFKNTLGLINGRVYYNLKTWYQMLALLPGYSINAGFMENMMGVKERFDLNDHQQISKVSAWWKIIKMGFQMIARYQALPKKRKAFQRLLDETIATYKAIDFNKKSANQLMDLYLQFEKLLLNEWKAPLLNDFFAMIWFGILQKETAAYKISQNPNIHNDLLCGSNDIISTQPIHRSIALATMVSENEKWKQLLLQNAPAIVWETIVTQSDYVALKEAIELYIYDFGERCVGELKLETISYTQDPSLFVQVLQSYVRNNITASTINTQLEIEIRNKAESELETALKGKFFKKWFINKALKNTRTLVSSRENLRYERTRAFGIVRAIFNAMGHRFYAENILLEPRDIFYLSKEEIFAYIEGTSISQDLKSLVALRKQEFDYYKTLSTPSERFATYGMIYHANDFYSKQKLDIQEGALKGIGCCPGIVRAKVKVVMNPQEVNDMEGAILVTSSTDPGWVTLFPSASGIIVERGSLLSHSAIVSREMGKPCIVSVSGLLQRLKTGDEIEMDGSTGFIKIINEEA